MQLRLWREGDFTKRHIFGRNLNSFPVSTVVYCRWNKAEIYSNVMLVLSEACIHLLKYIAKEGCDDITTVYDVRVIVVNGQYSDNEV